MVYEVTKRASYLLFACTILAFIFSGISVGLFVFGLLLSCIGVNYWSWLHGGSDKQKEALYRAIPMGSLFVDLYPSTALAVDSQDRSVEIQDVVVTSYVRLEDEFLFMLAVENGWETSEPLQLAFADSSHPVAAKRAAEEFEYMFKRWHDNGTLLTLAQAEGKVGVLAESSSLFLPLG